MKTPLNSSIIKTNILMSDLSKKRLPSTKKLFGKQIFFEVNSEKINISFYENDKAMLTGITAIGLEDYNGALTDVVEFKNNALFIDFLFPTKPMQTLTVVADINSHVALFVVTTMGERKPQPDKKIKYALTTKFYQTFHPAIIRREGLNTTEVKLPHVTTDFIGKRALYYYDDNNETIYEHIYLNSQWYSYNVIKGERRGDANTDEISYFKLSDSLYVVAWRETLIDLSVVFAYDMAAMRTTGKGWGMPLGENTILNLPAGATIKALNTTVYPIGLEPS